MKTLKLSTRIALVFFGIAVVLFMAAAVSSELGNYFLGSAVISIALGCLAVVIESMVEQETALKKFIVGAMPVALIYFIVTILYLVFFKECEALGTTSGVLMSITAVYAVVAFVLHHVNEWRQ